MDKKEIKIVTIGGGSSYTPELIEGFIKRSNELPIKEIWLVDIEDGKEKLEIVGAMAKRMVKAAKLNWKINLTLNRREALKDADFVTTQFRVGLLDARIKDERIPLSHGLMGQETNGAGGMFKAFRTIPVILEIIEDIKELCPNAWLINFTNPAGMITEAAIKYGGFNKTIGLCNVPINCIKQDSKALELEEEDLFFKFGGINHFHYHRVWDSCGNERTKELIELLYNPINEDSNNEAVVANIKESKFIYEQIKDLGLLPCPYHNYYYATDDMLNEELESFSKGQTRAEVVKKTEEELFELYKDINLDYKPEQLTKRGGAYYSDSACEVISSIFNDKRNIMVVSTLNKGAIIDLPYDSVAEVSSIITSHGPEPICFGQLDASSRGMLQLMKSMEQETILAAISGDYNKALQAFIINPLVPSGNVAKTVLDELLLAHKRYLPQFKEDSIL
ncbi:6-phospho-beta-glucosidase [Clostridium botulinum]|uniref:6-phospho-beta-glucosidase n=1 Tax=Clostridium botulinum TaxID=1491 RepID=A0A6B4QEG2_CLOBO|nr:6-phospho-beta-glucosidase [Clostridium botulinum]MCS6109395.1 6-phospho-beta-glucosidase [Clostridium botulinum]NFE12332.1 6-phospho-beta-glucosidase [Clostridium botulinum]NFE58505.1 6-phospho-beta-glucosidase [Clostridium botulinum]NFE95308.1 6-phospho-beta-glucosidase [Clostridium botulinum]NFF87086.1 6-phospho-beta-glucosidase [Clostridium botulinum]